MNQDHALAWHATVKSLAKANPTLISRGLRGSDITLNIGAPLSGHTCSRFSHLCICTCRSIPVDKQILHDLILMHYQCWSLLIQALDKIIIVLSRAHFWNNCFIRVLQPRSKPIARHELHDWLHDTTELVIVIF